MKSIIQSEKECFICANIKNLESHHIFHGTANRKLSEKYGLKVWLCNDHHTGSGGVHRSKEFDNHLKRIGQKAFERKYGSREDFMRIFGKNYL